MSEHLGNPSNGGGVEVQNSTPEVNETKTASEILGSSFSRDIYAAADALGMELENTMDLDDWSDEDKQRLADKIVEMQDGEDKQEAPSEDDSENVSAQAENAGNNASPEDSGDQDSKEAAPADNEKKEKKMNAKAKLLATKIIGIALAVGAIGGGVGGYLIADKGNNQGIESNYDDDEDEDGDLGEKYVYNVKIDYEVNDTPGFVESSFDAVSKYDSSIEHFYDDNKLSEHNFTAPQYDHAEANEDVKTQQSFENGVQSVMESPEQMAFWDYVANGKIEGYGDNLDGINKYADTLKNDDDAYFSTNQGILGFFTKVDGVETETIDAGTTYISWYFEEADASTRDLEMKCDHGIAHDYDVRCIRLFDEEGNDLLNKTGYKERILKLANIEDGNLDSYDIVWSSECNQLVILRVGVETSESTPTDQTTTITTPPTTENPPEEKPPVENPPENPPEDNSKNEEAEKERAGENVDQRELNENETPKTEKPDTSNYNPDTGSDRDTSVVNYGDQEAEKAAEESQAQSQEDVKNNGDQDVSMSDLGL